MTRALTVAIQAGGKSSRMGTDKAFVLLDGKPLIEHVLDKVRQIDPAEILIVIKTPERYAAYEGVRLLHDYPDDWGALGELLLALIAAQHNKTKYVLMVGCDMPLLNSALLAFIADMQKTPPYHAIVPRWNRQAEGLHALFDAGGRLGALREDVGRHNAMDKLIGWALLQGNLPLERHLVLVSGRASFELVQKALVARVPLFCAISAPSSLAVGLARRFGMALVGFLREDSFNIYCGQERIEQES